jgi:hypothetical protein
VQDDQNGGKIIGFPSNAMGGLTPLIITKKHVDF